jgi:hypothetical protein
VPKAVDAAVPKAGRGHAEAGLGHAEAGRGHAEAGRGRFRRPARNYFGGRLGTTRGRSSARIIHIIAN